MEKTWFMAPMEYILNRKGITAAKEYVPMIHSLNEKAMVLRKIFLKKYNIKDTMLIEISFMQYMKLTRVMLPVVFEEFEVAYIFLLIFSFCYHC